MSPLQAHRQSSSMTRRENFGPGRGSQTFSRESSSLKSRLFSIGRTRPSHWWQWKRVCRESIISCLPVPSSVLTRQQSSHRPSETLYSIGILQSICPPHPPSPAPRPATPSPFPSTHRQHRLSLASIPSGVLWAHRPSSPSPASTASTVPVSLASIPSGVLWGSRPPLFALFPKDSHCRHWHGIHQNFVQVGGGRGGRR
jgi:hypothetical protein